LRGFIQDSPWMNFSFLNLAYHLAAVGKSRERSENDHRMTTE